MRTSTRLSIFAAAWLAAGALAPRTGAVELQLDSTFGVNGIVVTNFGTNNRDEPKDLVIQPDGKILTGGQSTNLGDGTWWVAISRHTSEGVPDSGFGTDGRLLTRFNFRDAAFGIALQEDGKIVAAGEKNENTGSGNRRGSIYRFHSDGAVDSSFSDDGWVATELGCGTSFAELTVRPDGRIKTGGSRFLTSCNALVAQDCDTDGNFVGGGSLGSTYFVSNYCGAAFTNDGKTYAASTRDLGGSFYEFLIARFDSSGNLDPPFNILVTGVGAYTYYREVVVAVHPDGRVLLGGTTKVGAGTPAQFTVLCYTDAGVPDSTFGTNGRVDIPFSPQYSLAQLYDIDIDPNGRILLAGRSYYGIGLARLLPNGQPDSTFSDDGLYSATLFNDGDTNNHARAVKALSDGRILVAGHKYSGGEDYFLAQYITGEVSTGVEASSSMPKRLVLRAAPNPSRGETAIRFGLSRSEPVTIDVFDVAGRAVRRIHDGELPAGMHEVRWDGREASGRSAAPGIFFARVVTPEGSRTAKVIRVR